MQAWRADSHQEGSFASTRWSLVCAAGGGRTPEARSALDELCRTYWYPLYCYIRRRGHAHSDAEDLVQGFFVHLFDRDLFGAADRQRGKLRGLLLASLQFFMADERRRAGAAKRGGGLTFVPLDTTDAEARYAGEPADVSSPDLLFDRRWATTVLERAFGALAAAWQKSGKEDIFTALRPFLMATLDGDAARQLGAALGMTENHVKVSLHRLREQFGAVLRREVGETVSSEEEIEEEMAALRAASAH